MIGSEFEIMNVDWLKRKNYKVQGPNCKYPKVNSDQRMLIEKQKILIGCN